ncbi:carbohydrate binding domain-containing protein, partial [Streptomyces vinaceus]|uniref:carbohydrate binding domain-containing protein n=1 Tax=Streptomyces vinaceus TaxID=1960 RepID=UPI0035DE8101
MPSFSAPHRFRRNALAGAIATGVCFTGTALAAPQAGAAVTLTQAATKADVPPPPPATELLKDGGFDQYTGPLQSTTWGPVPQSETGWQNHNKNKTIEIWRSNDGFPPHSGQQHVELSKGEGDGIYQDVDVTPGSKLHLSMWFDWRTATDEGTIVPHAYLTVHGGHSAGVPLTPVTKSGSWTQFTGTYTVPKGATKLGVEVRPEGNNNGQLIDSVSLRVEPPAPVLKTTAVKPDPGEDIAYTT